MSHVGPLDGLAMHAGGSSAAMACAVRLLRSLGAEVEVDPGAAARLAADARSVSLGDPGGVAADWAASGAMWLTGPPDGPALLPPGNAASSARGAALVFELLSAMAGQRVQVPGHRLLGERAAAAGLSRQGPASPSGAFRLLPTRDGVMGLSLARTADVELVPALVEHDAGGVVDAWEAVSRWAAGQSAAEAVARARLLGLAACVPEERRNRCGSGPMRAGSAPTSPVNGRLVVDLSALWAGPLCAHLLGLTGARVIKVESLARPDGTRRGPAAFYRLLHAGHECVALDFTSAQDRARLVGLLTSADVVIESSRPRAMTQLGIDPEAIVSSAVDMTWVSITAYGRTGPGSSWVGYGDDVAVAAGLVATDPRTGTLVPCGDAIADPLTGLHAAVVALASLMGGGSRLVDVAMCDVVAATLGPLEVDDATEAGEVERPRIRPSDGEMRPLGADTERVLSELGLR